MLTLEDKYKQIAKEMSRISSLNSRVRLEIERLKTRKSTIRSVINLLKGYGYNPRTKKDCLRISWELREKKLELERKWNQLYHEIKEQDAKN